MHRIKAFMLWSNSTVVKCDCGQRCLKELVHMHMTDVLM
jgi:hypothetical protein